MKTVKISNEHIYFKVDDEDYSKVILYKWSRTGRNKTLIHGYVGGKLLQLSNFIMNSFAMFDHKDRDYLNNQKENLRKCTASQNMANRAKYGNYSSKYKGVSYCKRDDCWRAHIQINGKTKSLGTFMTERAAAISYNIEAKVLFGEFAFINKIEKLIGV